MNFKYEENFNLIYGNGIKKEDKNLLLDSVFASMEEQKKEIISSPDTKKLKVKGLIVPVRGSISGRITKHHHYYGPRQILAGVDSLTFPYNKPILTHHQESQDAIGRVIDARYIVNKQSDINGKNLSILTDATDYSSATVRKAFKTYRELMLSDSWKGFGYSYMTLNVVDKVAIEKILDSRYSTVSMGYDTDNVWCSECGRDLLSDNVSCKHRAGKKGGTSVLLFGDLSYREISMVNTPAEMYAMIALNKAKLDKDSIVRACSEAYTNIGFYDCDSNTYRTIGQLLKDYSSSIFSVSKINNDKNGDYNMELTIQDIKKLELKDLVDKLNETIEIEDSKLDFEQIEKLEDKDFVGAGRILPAHNKIAIEASLSLLEVTKDSKEKKELIDFLNQRLKALTSAPKTKTPKEEPNVVSVEKTKDGYKYSKNGKELEKTELKDFVEGQMLAYVDLHRVDSADKAVEAIKCLISKIDEKIQEEALDLLSKEKISELESRIDNYKNEIEVLTGQESVLIESLKEVTDSLKDNLVEKIIKHKIASTDKTDPSKDYNSIKDKLRVQSVEQLKFTLSNMDMLSCLEETEEATEIQPQSATEHSTMVAEMGREDSSSIDKEEIQKRINIINKNYINMSQSDSDIAEKYYAFEMSKIEELKKQIKK